MKTLWLTVTFLLSGLSAFALDSEFKPDQTHSMNLSGIISLKTNDADVTIKGSKSETMT